jgi:hypothetical protein
MDDITTRIDDTDDSTAEGGALDLSEAPTATQDAPSDADLARAYENQQGGLKDLSDGEDEAESRAGAAAVAAARDDRKLRDGEAASALDWFLNEDPAAVGEETQTLELNFGTQENERMIPWTIKPVPMEVMRAIRKKAQNTRLARTTGESDEYKVNLEIVVEGTVDPDIKEATRILNEQGRFPGDPVDALRAKFQSKPGYIAQIAGRIMTLSGFNDEDVRDAERAAKN